MAKLRADFFAADVFLFRTSFFFTSFLACLFFNSCLSFLSCWSRGVWVGRIVWSFFFFFVLRSLFHLVSLVLWGLQKRGLYGGELGNNGQLYHQTKTHTHIPPLKRKKAGSPFMVEFCNLSDSVFCLPFFFFSFLSEKPSFCDARTGFFFLFLFFFFSFLWSKTRNNNNRRKKKQLKSTQRKSRDKTKAWRDCRSHPQADTIKGAYSFPPFPSPPPPGGPANTGRSEIHDTIIHSL